MSEFIDVRTTPVDFQTFKTITNSNGLFKTWAEIEEEMRSPLLTNSEIMGAKISNPVEVIGDNIIFENYSNKNILPLINDITKRNNTLAKDKMVMILYEDYMGPLEFDIMDSRSCIDWSTIISEAVASMLIAKQDQINMETIDTIMRVSIALGNVRLIEGANEINLNYNEDKALGLQLAHIRIQNRTKRGLFQKGFDKELERFLLSPALSLNLLAGLTAGSNSASPEAYTDTKKRFKIEQIFGHSYETATMYLGQDIGMSEFQDDKGIKQNTGAMTGNLIRPYTFSPLCGLLFYNGSIATYGHNYGTVSGAVFPSRTKTAETHIYRYNVAIKPIYAGMNIAFFSEIPTLKSYIDLNGNTVPALDLNTADGMNKLINDLYNKQPQLYSKFGWNGSSNLSDGAVKKIWTDNTITWKATKSK